MKKPIEQIMKSSFLSFSFIILSVIGLRINQALMWVCVDHMHVYYMISKIGVTGVVMV